MYLVFTMYLFIHLLFFQVWLGPNAVLAFKREGYRWSDVSLKDLKEILTYPGFYKLAVKYVKFGSMEMVRMYDQYGNVGYTIFL